MQYTYVFFLLFPLICSQHITPIILPAHISSHITHIHHLRTMHTSTGNNYLIVNGGKNTNHELWALPIINTTEDSNIESMHIAENALLNSAALIGTIHLPIAPTTPISHLEIVHDTIYVAINCTPNEYNDAGIFYSQALFNAYGDIIGWTPWTKRATPDVEGVSFFSLDPATGSFHITTNSATRTTQWQNHSYLSRIFADGCHCALDLDQATRGFLHNTADRYALFGGINKVLFMRISHAHDITSLASPQMVITDFHDAENSFLSQLPANSGAVTHLAYSKRDSHEKNFFFAATNKGLFVFSDNNGDGFFAHELNTLNQKPFTTGTWKQVPTIEGAIIDLACAGNALYVLSSHTTNTPVLKTTLYVIPFNPLEQEKPVAKNTTSSLFSPDNIHIIAESGNGIFANITTFSAIAIIATSSECTGDGDSAEKREQLILATSNGLFMSDACQETKEQYVLAGIADACDQLDAQWKRIPETDYTFSYIGTHDIPIQHNVTPLSYITTKKEFCSSLHHIYGSKNPLVGPNKSLISCNTFSQYNNISIPGRVNALWSDGGRSFFITTILENNVRKNKLLTAANSSLNELVQQSRTFFWIKNIGATGLVMAGTDQGVIMLG